jgi:molybdenum cofactor guanylyltransferase
MKMEAYILVGGRSSRLGRDKALERIGGMTLAERALEAVRNSRVASKITFVTGNNLEFTIEAARLDAPFVFDLTEGRGPLGGLHAALANTEADWIFLLACDLPMVTAEVIAALRGCVRKEEHEFGAVVPEQPDRRLQPLCAFYSVSAARPIVEEILGRPRVAPPMHEVVSLLKPRIVKPDEYLPAERRDLLFTNVNTQADLNKVRSHNRDR